MFTELQIKSAIRVVSLLAVIGFVVGLGLFINAKIDTAYQKGLKDKQSEWTAASLREANRQLGIEAKQAEATTTVVTKYVDRVKIVRVKADTIVKEVPLYVTQADDEHCLVPDSFGMLWNKANGSAEIPVPESAGDADAPSNRPGLVQAEAPRASDITLSDVARQHIAESEYTLTLEQQVIGLQEWIRSMQKEANTP